LTGSAYYFTKNQILQWGRKIGDNKLESVEAANSRISFSGLGCSQSDLKNKLFFLVLLNGMIEKKQNQGIMHAGEQRICGKTYVNNGRL